MMQRDTDRKALEAELGGFRNYLEEQEREESTILKYMHDAAGLLLWMRSNGGISKKTMVEYKLWLAGNGYKAVTINCMMASVNVYLNFLGHPEYKVKRLKIQRQAYCPEKKLLRLDEYRRLLTAAEKQHRQRLALVLQTICATGIRVSELPFVTAEAVREGTAVVHLKGKTRTVILPRQLRCKLNAYAKQQKIRSGPVFLTRAGRVLDRTAVWKEMKAICGEAHVEASKVFPHNLRHLFARVFYNKYKDIVKLADILGHSNVNTTRIYIISTVDEHRESVEKLKLVS